MIKITLLDFICIYERVRSETHPQACTLSHTAWLLLSRADSTSSWLLLLLLFLPLWLWWYLLYPWRWPSSANCHISCSLGTKIDRDIIRLLLLLLGHVLFSVLDPLPPVMTDASKRCIYMLKNLYAAVTSWFLDLTGSCLAMCVLWRGPIVTIIGFNVFFLYFDGLLPTIPRPVPFRVLFTPLWLASCSLLALACRKDGFSLSRSESPQPHF